MGITHLSGLEVAGVPTMGIGGPLNIDYGGNIWFVNGNASGVGDGTSPQTPFLTMASAFAQVGSGDTIYFCGNIREQLVTPVGIFNVTIIGQAPVPVYADAHSVTGVGFGGYSGATWRAPTSPTATTALLRIQQQGWRLFNFTFAAAPAASPQVEVFRNAGADDAERDGSRASFYQMLFAGGPIGIRMNGGPANVWVKGCHFQDCTTSGIGYTVGAGVGVNLDHVIEGNTFDGCANNIVLPSTKAAIRYNTMGAPTTKNISLAGGSLNNVGPGNLIAVASSYDTDNDPGTTDTWAGNYLVGGITTANPT